jgi:RNA polymerase sigma-70 factor (ECF subfamily)
MDGPNVRALMLRMHRGEESAAETLWAHFAPRLTAYARVMLPKGMGHLAEDVVQGVFVKVLGMRRGRLRGVRDGAAFLFRVTRNEAVNAGRGELREMARRRAQEARSGGAVIGDDAARVLGAIEGLTYEQREVILLRYIGGLTIDQVSEALGVKQGTVASRSRLAVGHLREVLGVEIDEVCDG